MSLHEILTNYGSYIYGVVIFFGGSWGLKYFAPFKKTVHNFLIFATIWALVFLLMELFVTGTFQKEHAINYLLTYLVVTSVYELVGKYVFPKK